MALRPGVRRAAGPTADEPLRGLSRSTVEAGASWSTTWVAGAGGPGPWVARAAAGAGRPRGADRAGQTARGRPRGADRAGQTADLIGQPDQESAIHARESARNGSSGPSRHAREVESDRRSIRPRPRRDRAATAPRRAPNRRRPNRRAATPPRRDRAAPRRAPNRRAPNRPRAEPPAPRAGLPGGTGPGCRSRP